MYKFRKVVKNGTTTYHVSIDNRTEVTVSKEVYEFMTRDQANMRYRMRRDGKCGTPDYRWCGGDCGHCPWIQEGSNILSIEKAFGSSEEDVDMNPLDNIPDKDLQLIDDIVADKALLQQLMTKLDTVVPNGGSIVAMLLDGSTDREMTRALGVKRQSTLSYRKQKVVKYLKEHWDEFIET